jgi:hypothetical protein
MLDLRGTPITDAGLPALQQLRSLESLNVRGTAISEAGLAALQQALPQAIVEY